MYVCVCNVWQGANPPRRLGSCRPLLAGTGYPHRLLYLCMHLYMYVSNENTSLYISLYVCVRKEGSGSMTDRPYVVASMSRVRWFFWWLSLRQIWPRICCQRCESISFIMCTRIASKIARHSVYAAHNALQGIIQERLYRYVYVCMYAMYVRNTYTYTHTFMDLSKDLINILCSMYVCMYVWVK